MPRWTQEARRKQAEIQKTRQSWRHSTGPKTAAGKARSSLNAWKHGMRSAPALKLRMALRRQSHFIKQVNAYLYLSRRSNIPSLQGGGKKQPTPGGFIAKTRSRQAFGKNRREAPWNRAYGYPLPAAQEPGAEPFASLRLRDEYPKGGNREPLYFLWANAIKGACFPEQDKIRSQK